jgi:N-acetyl-gamma-glutamyl-phosphate reductase/acetylglutamate kinase
MDLRHVSSRELAGQKLKGYEKREITYENLSADDVRRMEEKGEIDCWVMALPNGTHSTSFPEIACTHCIHRRL